MDEIKSMLKRLEKKVTAMADMEKERAAEVKDYKKKALALQAEVNVQPVSRTLSQRST